MKKQNIIMFVADQMRSDSLHHLGNKASITPNLDQIVNEGVSFEMHTVKIQYVYLQDVAF